MRICRGPLPPQLFACGSTKRVHPPHQTLAFKGADGFLIRHHQKDSHRAIWRSKRLLLFDRRAFGKRFERRRDQAERIERKLELRPRRAGFDLLPQPMQAIANLLRLQKRHCLDQKRWASGSGATGPRFFAGRGFLQVWPSANPRARARPRVAGASVPQTPARTPPVCRHLADHTQART